MDVGDMNIEREKSVKAKKIYKVYVVTFHDCHEEFY